MFAPALFRNLQLHQQFFRRECFESLGGLIPLPVGGWDAITCVQARMNGFKTATFPDLIVDHLKPRNSAEGNLFRRYLYLGIRDYDLAYHPLFEVAKCCSRCLNYPLLIGALAHLTGYVWAASSGRKLSVPGEIVRYIRQEQLTRLRRAVSPWSLG